MHPKSALQELAAARRLGVRRSMRLVGRTGAAPCARASRSRSRSRTHGEAEAEGVEQAGSGNRSRRPRLLEQLQ